MKMEESSRINLIYSSRKAHSSYQHSEYLISENRPVAGQSTA